ncbi:hypothetical protein ACJX0J_024463, partial [Zea mays]
ALGLFWSVAGTLFSFSFSFSFFMKEDFINNFNAQEQAIEKKYAKRAQQS